MKFNRHLQDLDAKSHNDEIYILLTNETKCGRKVAQISRKPFQKKKPHEISIKVKNLIFNPKVLELEQYYSWIEVVFQEEFKFHKVALKIKESNLFDLIENSELDFGEIKQNSLMFVFYKSSEIYLCPQESETASKAYSIKSNLEIKKVEIKPNHVYKLKSGKLAIHLEKTTFTQVDFTKVKSVRPKDIHIFIKTDCYTMRELKGLSFTGRDLGSSITNPYVSEEGVFNLSNKDVENFIEWEKNSFSKKACSIGLYDKGLQMINNEILLYIESLNCVPKSENESILIKDIKKFAKKNLSEKFDDFKFADKAKASIAQAYILYHYVKWRDPFTFNIEEVLEQDFLKIFSEKEDIFFLPYDYKKDFFQFSEEKKSRYTSWSNYEVNSEYRIRGKNLELNDNIPLFMFIGDLLEMKSKNMF